MSKLYDSTSNMATPLLQRAGLSPSEIKVYVAGLKPETTTQGLMKATGLPRPTVLAALKRLRELELCVVRKWDGRSYRYVMQPASRLKVHLGQKMAEMDELIEQLNAVPMLREKPRMTVTEVQGEEAVQGLLLQALWCRSRQWHIIAPRDNALAHMPASYIKFFKKMRDKRQIKSETLWDASWQGQNVPLKDVLMRKPRYVPASVSKKIPSMVIVFDDCVLSISGTTEPSAVLVQDAANADTFRILFEMAWRSSR
jgi:sugar-specific transcriptional regulator TrmB